MRWLVSLLILTVLTPTAWGKDTGRSALDKAITHGAEALVKLQGEDGGWHSETYGLLKPGVATTAFVLATLSRLPDAERRLHAAAIERGVAFLKAAEGKDGALGTKGDWLEYPVYATALGVSALSRLKPVGWERTIAPWVEYLKKAQHQEATGAKPDDARFGGWSPDGMSEQNTAPRADISATRYALQALRDGRVGADDPVWARARSFLERLRTPPDGDARAGEVGYAYEATLPQGNKAGRFGGEDSAFRPYGSPTADGLLALQVLQKAGGVADDAAVAAPRAWLDKHAHVEVCPGFEGTEAARVGWDASLACYYRAALAEAYAAGPSPGEKEWKKLADAVLKEQHDSGLWASTQTLMKENDPLIATPLSLDVLLLSRGALARP
ncbi:MAG: hypothetical protein L6R28_23825 [Planctomycetes bacterium]|nr:hypothetical protein [Planctomycetota bacterium]